MHGVITKAEYFRILAGILSHPVDLEIDKLLKYLDYHPYARQNLNSECVQSRSLQYYNQYL
jgi:hypothetical protein